MSVLNRSLREKIIVTVSGAAGFAVFSLALALFTGSASAHSHAALSDCSTLVIPTDREVNTLLDYENELLTVTYYDEALGEEAVVTIDYADPRCRENASVRHEIDHALKSNRETRIGLCRSIGEMIRNNVREMRGQQVDHEAARRYVAEWCG